MKNVGAGALLCCLLFAAIPAAAPLTAQDNSVLFYIERNTNLNKVYYSLSITREGVISRRKPVLAYWIMWEKDSTGRTREKLTLLEWTRAYGFAVSHGGAGAPLTMKLAVYPSRPVKVYLRDGRAVAETIINGRPCRLEKISITSQRGKLIPKVDSVILCGTSIDTGESLREELL